MPPPTLGLALMLGHGNDSQALKCPFKAVTSRDGESETEAAYHNRYGRL
jgi:hypothetical protein